MKWIIYSYRYSKGILYTVYLKPGKGFCLAVELHSSQGDFDINLHIGTLLSLLF